MTAINKALPALISPALLEELERAFGQPIIRWDTAEADIKWAAAQYEVVKWIKAKVGKHQSLPTAHPADAPNPQRPSVAEPTIRMGVPD